MNDIAEYEERERRYNESLPGIVGNFMTSVSLADGQARMKDVEITRQILDLPNVTLEQKIDLLHRDQPMVLSTSLPAAIYIEPRPFLAESVKFNMSMNVSAGTIEEDVKDSAREGSGTAGFKVGPFRGSMSMKASSSTHSSKKRTSDYSATTDMELVMTRHPLPEGYAKSMDTMNRFADAINQINIKLAEAEASRIMAQDNPELPSEAREQLPEGGDGDVGDA